jgi:hypothetical protein
VLDTKAKSPQTNIMAAPIQYLGEDAKRHKIPVSTGTRPIIWSKHEPNTYYHGAQHFVYETTDMGLNVD